MTNKALRLISFSPTGTTKKILTSIAEGINLPIKEDIDLTKPQAEIITIENNMLTLVGVPVHAGRMPLTAVERLRTLKANNVPTILVVVYGNRNVDDTLIELKTEVQNLGFNPKFAGTFISEHSWNTATIKIAEGRPDYNDLQKAKEFGKTISLKINKKEVQSSNYQLNIPGNPVYKERKVFPKIKPIVDEELCNTCGDCEKACPVSAIQVNSLVDIDENKCILCSACIKQCPQEAMAFKDPWLTKVAGWLSENFKERKEPEFFF